VGVVHLAVDSNISTQLPSSGGLESLGVITSLEWRSRLVYCLVCALVSPTWHGCSLA